jgi:hypothetical protein
MSINIGATDYQLSLTQALPAAGNAVTTGNIDLQAVGPFSASNRLGFLYVDMPAVAGNTAGAGITIAMQVANASLTTSSVAPALPAAGTFAAPNPSEIVTVAAVGASGSVANRYYMPLPKDANGSCYQFYNFVITVPAQATTASEVVTIGWQNEE